jgi:hypothetical protein
MVLEGYDRRAAGAERGRKGCPPHGPHLIDVLEDVDQGISYAARCLRCGLAGPVSKDGPGAKLAFDQRWP